MPDRNWDSLAKRLLATGLIDHPSEEFLRELRKILTKCSHDTQLRWLEVLKVRMVRVPAGITCEECSGTRAVNFLLGASVSEECGACSRTLDTPSGLLVNDTLDSCIQSQASGFEKGAACEQAVEDSFGSLCISSDAVTIIDRYLIPDAVRAETRQSGSSGLVRLMALAERSGVTQVNLAVGLGGKIGRKVLSPSGLANETTRILKPVVGGMSVSLEILDASAAQREMHDRWIGFSWGGYGQTSWSLGKGLSQFDGAAASQHYGFARQRDSRVAVHFKRLQSLAMTTRKIT